ncbi:MAG: proline dehydrogenase family protein [Deltaproteobacteria bacterium]|nr:proline dehydrogenase family protein [Deltaproteobacteria bacterium]
MAPEENLATILAGIAVDPGSELSPTLQRTLGLARYLQRRGAELQTSEEHRQQAELERMMQSPSDKATLTQITDQAFRSKTPSRAAEQLVHILDVQGVPRFFSPFERAMLKGFQSFGSYLPGVSMPMVRDRMRAETANVILPAEQEVLSAHLGERREQGVRMNVNYLGEAMLGEEAAEERLQSYLAALQLPEIEVISVKVSTIYSQITPLARRHAVKVLADRLELLYRAAAKARFERRDGSVVPKFVYLDMEEYRDLGVTAEAFMRTLERPGLEAVDAGIALQAYIPDSYLVQQRLLRWAKRRVAKGGSPVTMRLVKGANMEAERFEASVAGWALAPYSRKLDTDANYKRMLQVALTPDNVQAVRVGVASHNVFEVAYALVLADERKLTSGIQIEMLEGMANHQRRAMCELVSNMLLYAPATKREDFLSAIGYLVRRLDENTGPENFLRHAFKLEVDSTVWKELEGMFLESYALQETVSSAPRRTQDRTQEVDVADSKPVALRDFDNDPHTDFSLDQNLAWAEALVARWREREGTRAAEVPIVVGGHEVFDREVVESHDPSRPGVVVARYRLATAADVERAVRVAAADPSGWRKLPEGERASVLARAAGELKRARGDLLGVALAEGGKLLAESDPEVSEAVDFVEYYAASAREFASFRTVRVAPKGVVAVVSPWNFPIAIPCGGIAAALAAGNTVLLKPSPLTVLCAYELCQCFWRAGVPRDALQFVPCTVEDGGRQLVSSPAVDVVVLTGGTATALAMLEAKPDMNLLAETGGKNATIVTAMSDRDLAIKHVLHSAFGHSGQKCSATSLLVLEGEVYDDPLFRRTLVDAVKSLQVGSAWSFDTKVGPLIRPPSGHLLRGLKELDLGESWALLSENVDDNPCLHSPAIKWGVKPGSYSHMTEFFGPVLSVLRADDLAHAVAITNQTGYGLTSGIESLDEREIAYIREHVRAGNLYLNRVTTGAIVLRQPFGGVGKSAFGPGIKAGGPNYVAQLLEVTERPAEEVTKAPGSSRAARAVVATGTMLAAGVCRDEGLESMRRAIVDRLLRRVDDAALPASDAHRVSLALESFAQARAAEFAVEHDHFRLVGQDNVRRYRPVPRLRVRVHADDSAFDVLARVAAARVVGAEVTVSRPPGTPHPTLALLASLTASWKEPPGIVEESDEALAELVRKRGTDRVRYAAPERVPLLVHAAVGETGVHLARTRVIAEGRIELLWYVVEQSLSHDYHRYGNLGVRSEESRRPVD